MKSIPSKDGFKSKSEWEAHVWTKLSGGFAEAGSALEIEKSLDMLLTAHEKRQIINRAAAISLLKQGMSYREIGRILWLSPTTISSLRKSARNQTGYISRRSRNKKHDPERKPLTEEEWKQLKFDSWLESLFRIPEPPLKHPRLMRAIGLDDGFLKKSKRRF